MIQINEAARCTVVVNMDDKGSSCNNARMMIINPSNTPKPPNENIQKDEHIHPS
jgi:hypothetical protein